MTARNVSNIALTDTAALRFLCLFFVPTPVSDWKAGVTSLAIESEAGGSSRIERVRIFLVFVVLERVFSKLADDGDSAGHGVFVIFFP